MLRELQQDGKGRLASADNSKHACLGKVKPTNGTIVVNHAQRRLYALEFEESDDGDFECLECASLRCPIWTTWRTPTCSRRPVELAAALEGQRRQATCQRQGAAHGVSEHPRQGLARRQQPLALDEDEEVMKIKQLKFVDVASTGNRLKPARRPSRARASCTAAAATIAAGAPQHGPAEQVARLYLRLQPLHGRFAQGQASQVRHKTKQNQSTHVDHFAGGLSGEMEQIAGGFFGKQ